MRKKKLFVLGTAVLAAICIVCILLFGGKRPFQNLAVSDIAAVSVRLIPPDVTIDLDETEFARLAEILQMLVIYRRDDSWRKYDGQAVTFMITKTNGTQVSVMAYNPFLIIDGQGYRTRYESCEALSRFANSLR